MPALLFARQFLMCLTATLLMDSQHKVLLAEQGQTFAEDVEATAPLY